MKMHRIKSPRELCTWTARRCVWVVVAACSLLSAPAFAQPRPVGPRTVSVDAQLQQDAIAIFKEGKAAFEAGSYLLAVEQFKRADRAVAGAAPRFWLAQAFEKLGKPADAVAAYRGFIELNPPPASAYGKRVPEAQARIAALELVLPGEITFTIAPAAADPVFVVDGASGQRSPLSLKLGEHTVVITSQGFLPHSETFLVRGNEQRSVSIDLKPEVAPIPFTAPPKRRATVGTATILCYGLAGAGVVVGGAFGVLALKQRSQFYDAPTYAGADATERSALIADIAFGTALVAGITGTALLLVSPSPEPDRTAFRRVPVIEPWAGRQGGGASFRWTY